ncbi:MAG: THUMP domain-containing protein [Paludibacteraceae bacterium]|nr:THUMP domain-containing protein [Paludibacteraceae bacterium]
MVETEKFELIAKTFQGLEEVLAKELINLGADDVEILKRGVRFSGDLEMMYKANLHCRTALRILKPIYKFEAHDADEVYEKIKSFDWSKLMDNSKTFAVDAVVFSDNFNHSKYLAYRVKDGIADYFNEKTGKRPSVRLVNPDVQLNIHIAQDKCTLSIDSSGEPLSKRGYREIQTEAPINEVLAAGMLLLAGWDGQCDLIDPMCGSGTILIEAALIALNIAPGIYRKQGFAFEKWPDFNQEIFDKLYNDDSNEREFEHMIYGSDILLRATEIAETNVKRAGVAKYVSLKTCPFQQLPAPTEKSMLVFNPPYGERLFADMDLFNMIGTKLKHDYTDMEAWIITPPTEAAEKIGLRPSEKHQLLNGNIECEFRKYEMFSGRRDDFIRKLKEKEAEKGDDQEETPKVYVRPDSYIERGSRERTEEEEYDYRMRRHRAFEKSIHEAAGEYWDERAGEWRKKGERYPRRSDDEKGEGEDGFKKRRFDDKKEDGFKKRRFDDKKEGDFRRRRFDDEENGERRREFRDRDDRKGGFKRDRDGKDFKKRDDRDRGPRREFRNRDDRRDGGFEKRGPRKFRDNDRDSDRGFRRDDRRRDDRFNRSDDRRSKFDRKDRERRFDD